MIGLSNLLTNGGGGIWLEGGGEGLEGSLTIIHRELCVHCFCSSERFVCIIRFADQSWNLKKKTLLNVYLKSACLNPIFTDPF